MCIVERTGLYGSSTAWTGRSSRWRATIPRVMRSQAVSARLWYRSWAGQVLPLQTRWSFSHGRVIRLSWPNRCSFGSSPGSRHLVSRSRLVRWKTRVEGRISSRCSRLRSTPSPTMPSFRVIEGPTRSGVSSRVELSSKVADSRFSGSSTRYPCTRGNSDLARIALRRNRLDLDRLARRRLSRMRLVG